MIFKSWLSITQALVHTTLAKLRNFTEGLERKVTYHVPAWSYQLSTGFGGRAELK